MTRLANLSFPLTCAAALAALYLYAPGAAPVLRALAVSPLAFAHGVGLVDLSPATVDGLRAFVLEG